MTEPLGLNNKTAQYIKNVLSNKLNSKVNYSVFIFGSRATGNHREYSDLDLLIISSPDLSNIELSDLRSQFEESDLPIKIDLLTKKTCLPEYWERINSEKSLWFDKK